MGFHGIGPDCEWGGPVDGAAFIAILDTLVEQRHRVWSGTHTEVHKYDQERSSAAVNLLQATQNGIRLALTSQKDPRLYDYPLTQRTAVPAGWEHALVSQGDEAHTIEVIKGIVQYYALPDKGEIAISY